MFQMANNPNHDPLISLLTAIQEFGRVVVHQDKKDLHRYRDPIVTKNLSKSNFVSNFVVDNRMIGWVK